MGYFQIRKKKRGRNMMVTTTLADIIGAYEEARETERGWNDVIRNHDPVLYDG